MYFTESDPFGEVTKADRMFTLYIVLHILPGACSNCAEPLCKVMFPDSKIANKYACF